MAQRLGNKSQPKKAKKKSSPAKAKAAAPSALPPNQEMSAEARWRKHFPGIKKAKRVLEDAQDEVKEANAEYRNLLKAFKKDGGNVDVMILVMKDQGRDVEEVNRDLRDYNLFAKFLGMPIGTQLGLFDDGTTVASHVDDAKLAEQNGKNGSGQKLSTKATIEKAREEGAADGKGGKTARNNYPEGSPEALAYSAAYQKEQEAIASRFGGDGDGRPPTAH